MNLYFPDSMDKRLKEIGVELCKTNGEYALAAQMRGELWEKLAPVIMSNKELTLDATDFLDFQEYLQHSEAIAAIERHAAYRQGYLDCVAMLQGIGAL